MTDESKAKIVKTVRLGLWPDRAAEMHGIKPSTMRNERKRDSKFATALKEAEATAEASVHGKILRHMDKQWTAAAWMLERRWPERWAKREPDLVKAAKVTAAAIGPVMPANEDFGEYIQALAAAAASIGITSKPNGNDNANGA